MSDALPLPPRPDLDQYRTLARELQAASRSADSGAVRAWAERWVASLARLKVWAAAPEPRWLDHVTDQIAARWRRLQAEHDGAARSALTAAQFFLARAHGFASWPALVAHVGALGRGGTPISRFEAAADAIVDGDAAQLEAFVADDPELVRARSTRSHRSTLLHYVSANGVEDFRQRTPANIVAIAQFLLDAGADVNAESEAYGGRSTTLGLAATSVHPEEAGVQLELMQLLLDRGAVIDGPDGGSAVTGCLRNGRGAAAELLAQRGARLDLEAAAGVGRLDVVERLVDADGHPVAPATPRQLIDGFAWACQFGRTAVVELLLDRGFAIATALPHDGQTGLHWAAYTGHADTVALLVRRGAPIDARDASYAGTPLEWALYGWGTSSPRSQHAGYYGAVATLVRAGAALDPAWVGDDPHRERAFTRAAADPRMTAALRGEPAELLAQSRGS